MFNLVRDVADARVLDGYAGTGALGLEARSRGASDVVLVERDRQAARLARRNVDKVALAGVDLVIGTIEAHLRQEVAAARRYDLVLIDPPYGEAARAMKMLAKLLPPLFPTTHPSSSRLIEQSSQRSRSSSKRPARTARPV